MSYNIDKYTLKDDLRLLPVINNHLDPHKKQFFYIHLHGSHMSYSNKYDEEDADAIRGKNSVVDEYDRSIHHTDRFMRELYNIVCPKENNSIIYYVSDHGEEIGIGHGVKIKSKNQFNVPVITICNNVEQTDSIVREYIDPKYSRISTVNSSYIVANLIGYTISQQTKEEAIVNGRYVYITENEIMEHQCDPEYDDSL